MLLFIGRQNAADRIEKELGPDHALPVIRPEIDTERSPSWGLQRPQAVSQAKSRWL